MRIWNDLLIGLTEGLWMGVNSCLNRGLLRLLKLVDFLVLQLRMIYNSFDCILLVFYLDVWNEKHKKIKHWPYRPQKEKRKPGQFGSSPQEWYSGWNCMKTLKMKGLVVQSSCPAKYFDHSLSNSLLDTNCCFPFLS